MDDVDDTDDVFGQILKKKVRSLNLTIYRFVPGFDQIVSSIYGWILVWFSDALGSG